MHRNNWAGGSNLTMTTKNKHISGLTLSAVKCPAFPSANRLVYS